MDKNPNTRDDRVIHAPGSPEGREQELTDATERLVETGLGGEVTYPWDGPVSKE